MAASKPTSPMSKTPTTHIHRGAAAAAALSVTAMLWLSGCGGSSKGSGQNAGSQGPSAAAHPSGGGNNGTSTAANVPHSVRLAAARVGVISLTGCMRKEGIKLPPQRVSGPNPIYNPGGINTRTPQYQHAMHICLPKAIAAFNKRLKKH
jgi:hypothetical protein